MKDFFVNGIRVVINHNGVKIYAQTDYHCMLIMRYLINEAFVEKDMNFVGKIG